MDDEQAERMIELMDERNEMLSNINRQLRHIDQSVESVARELNR